jgi:formyl-CoA transferase
VVGEPAEDYDTRPKQAEHSVRLDRLLGEWIAERPLDECLEVMGKLEVVASRIYTVEDILADDTYRERENIVEIEDPDLGTVRMQNVIPRLTNYTGSVWRTAPALGEDNDLVYGEFLGKTEAQLEELLASDAISVATGVKRPTPVAAAVVDG